MPHRYDAQVLFDETVNIESTEAFIQRMRKNGDRIRFLHVLLAAMLRTIVDFPKANRFVRGRKVFARKDISFCFAMKKDMTLESEETVVKLVFNPKDTLMDIVKRVDEAIEKNKATASKNKIDIAARLFNLMPSFVLRFSLFLIRFLDDRRLLPASLIRLSPFHSSAFVTDMGSLGMPPVYHHIYDFGTTSFFIAFGPKRKETTHEKTRKVIDIRVVVDERIGDGYMMATVCKQLKRHLQDPSTLMKTPVDFPRDDEIR